MREWFIMMVSNWLQRLQPKSREEKPPEDSAPEEFSPCPICGEVWDEKEIFCYYCGYQMSDEELPLHPPPVRTESLTDPDGILDESSAANIRGRIDAIGKSKGFDPGILVVPKTIKDRITYNDERKSGYSLDGISYTLYNTWKMGSGTGLKGILIVIDPGTGDRVMVTGENGPDISGAEFRSWYSDFNPVLNPANGNSTRLLIEELEHIASKIESIR